MVGVVQLASQAHPSRTRKWPCAGSGCVWKIARGGFARARLDTKRRNASAKPRPAACPIQILCGAGGVGEGLGGGVGLGAGVGEGVGPGVGPGVGGIGEGIGDGCEMVWEAATGLIALP
jgi:hypothetical protein